MGLPIFMGRGEVRAGAVRFESLTFFANSPADNRPDEKNRCG